MLVPERWQDYLLVPQRWQDCLLVPQGWQDCLLVPQRWQDCLLVPERWQDCLLVPQRWQDCLLVPQRWQDCLLVPQRTVQYRDTSLSLGGYQVPVGTGDCRIFLSKGLVHWTALSSGTGYRPFQASSFFANVGLSILFLVDLRFFWQLVVFVP